MVLRPVTPNTCQPRIIGQPRGRWWLPKRVNVRRVGQFTGPETRVGAPDTFEVKVVLGSVTPSTWQPRVITRRQSSVTCVFSHVKTSYLLLGKHGHRGDHGDYPKMCCLFWIGVMRIGIVVVNENIYAWGRHVRCAPRMVMRQWGIPRWDQDIRWLILFMFIWMDVVFYCIWKWNLPCGDTLLSYSCYSIRIQDMLPLSLYVNMIIAS